MDGLHEWAASTISVPIGGQGYRLSPLRLVDFAAIERHLLNRLPDPLGVVLARLREFDEPQQRHLLELAYDDVCRGPRVSHADLWNWCETHEGQIFRLWLSLRRESPALTLADVEQLLAQATPGEEAAFREALNLLAGDPRGN
ncbi:MAG: hypothetical protein KF708_22390 [Pirellulales bacterium]|nr:hypothetical protein [Pirellulales bacterium]